MSNDSNKITRVNIKLYAVRLKNLAGFRGTSDPFCIVTLLASAPDKPKVLGRTEVIENSLSPAWTTQFQADYTFGVETKINVGVFDEVPKTGKHKPMGSAVFELGEILGARANVKAKKMKDGGTIYCCVTAAPDDCYGTFHLQLQSQFQARHGPFFVLSSHATQGTGSRVWHPVYRSEVQPQSKSAEWKALDIPIEKICGGELQQPILVEVYDYGKSGKHKIIGKFQTTVNGFMGAHQCKQELSLVHHGQTYGQLLVLEAKATGGNILASSAAHRYSASMPPTLEEIPPAGRTSASMPPKLGTISTPTSSKPISPLASGVNVSPSQYPISVSSLPPISVSSLPPISVSSLPPPLPPPAFSISDGPSYDPVPVIPVPPLNSKHSPTRPITNKAPKFVDYLSGGLEINLTVAIDFTGSNGDPCKAGTLHYKNPDEQQLNDYEKALTAVGSIVARYDSDQRFPVLGFGAKYKNQIQHCFQVGKTAESIGIHGVLQSYRSVFSTGLTMSGPTVFAEVIKHAANNAKRKWDQNSAIGKQSYEILLILTDGAVTKIDETRSAIKEASDAPLSIIIVGVGNDDFSSMKYLDREHEEDSETRDIVRFVEFSRYRNDRQALTRETLLEIPDQVVEYFYKQKHVMPLAPLTGSKVDIVEEEYDSDCDLDLSVSVGEDGSIRLAESQHATWDATSYGTAAAYLPPAMKSPPLNPPISSNSRESAEYASSAYIPPSSGHGPLSYSISPHVSPRPSVNVSSVHQSTAPSDSSIFIPSHSDHPPISSHLKTPPVSPQPHKVYARVSPVPRSQLKTPPVSPQPHKATTQLSPEPRSPNMTPYATPTVSPVPLRLTPYVQGKSPTPIPPRPSTGLPLQSSHGTNGDKTSSIKE